MKLGSIAKVQSGHISRGKIEPREDGTHFLLQAREVDAERLTYWKDTLIRFNPALSRKDWILKKGDILFMARGARNFSVILKDVPEAALAAACFFIIRVSSEKIVPGFLGWYLNQSPVEKYLRTHTGRGVHMPVVRRAALENIDIPVPPLEIQNKIAELDVLMRKEQELLDKLARKRNELVTSACLKTIEGS